MDELQAVRELFDERPPPSPEAVAAARARLLLRRRPRRRLLLRAGLPVSAAGAAAAAAVLTAVAVGAPTAGLGVYHLPAGAAGAKVGTTAAGRKALLTAARTVAAEKPGTIGRYWEASSVIGNFIRVGPADDRYAILEKTGNQQWTATAPKVWSPDIVRALGVQLASSASRAAWRRDGTPTTWNVGQELSIADPQGSTNGIARKLRAAPGKPTELSASLLFKGRDVFQFGGTSLTPHELLTLPANPTVLKAIILREYDSNLGYGTPQSYLFQVTPQLLTLPVTPAVRAALYQMLADLPGVRSLGRVRDVAGQRGVGVALSGRVSKCGSYLRIMANDTVIPSWTFSSCVVQQRLVISPRTGQPLAQELRYLELPAGQTWPAPDGLFSFELFGTARWTNASPPDIR
jgi:hypothetical protein